MASKPTLVAALFHLVLPLVQHAAALEGLAPADAALATDGECEEMQGDCALSVLQHRAKTSEPAAEGGEPAKESAVDGDGLAQGHDLGPPLYADADPAWDDPKKLGGVASSGHGPRDGSVQAAPANYCITNPNAERCNLYAKCRGHFYCVFGDNMVVPGVPVSGMEAITRENAAGFDYLWDVATAKCGTTNCVLLTNPMGYRTQDQLHLFFKYLTGDGTAMHSELETQMCKASGWTNLNRNCCGCGSSKARAFDSTPRVFTEVANAFGGGSLANVGISVWFTTACGFKTIVMATTSCNIEGTVTGR